MAPTGASLKLTGSVPSVLGGCDLLCICDMAKGYNTDAQAFVAALQPDLSDLEITEADETTPVPWRRSDSSVFSQAVGSEMLYVQAKPAGTDIIAWAGCDAPTGESSWAAVRAANDKAIAYYSLADGTDRYGTYDGNVGGSNPTFSTSKIGDGMQANTGETYMNIPGLQYESSPVNFADKKLSIMAWVRITDALDGAQWGGMRNVIYHVYGRGWRDKYDLWIETTGIVRATFTYQTNMQSTTAINDGQWHHIALTLEPITKRECLYVDGQLEASVYGSSDYGNRADDAVSVGSVLYWDGYAAHFPGEIDEFYLFQDEWTVTQVSNYYTMTSDPGSWFVVDGPAQGGAVAGRQHVIGRHGPSMAGQVGW